LSGEGFSERTSDVKMPRFSRDNEGDIMPALDALGLLPIRLLGNQFPGFSPGAILGDTVQRTKINVDEGGAHVASATALGGFSATISSQESPTQVVVDKPFLFALRDRVNGMLLATGYVGCLSEAMAAR
jgi:serine protease inhibitor